MTLLEKGDTLFGERNSKRPLKKLKVDYKDLQFYTCQIDKDDSNCIQTWASLPLVVHCTKIQNAQPKLIAYMSKRMPEAAKNYSITELEMCGLVINILSFVHLLKKGDFHAIVDHLAITHIMKSKAEPTTTELKGY